MIPFTRVLPSLAAAWLLGLLACLAPGLSWAAGDAPASRPRSPHLVVLVSVDQMRADQLTGPGLAYTGGYRRLLEGGAVYLDCRSLQAANETAPGHAVLSTGAWAHRNGITANYWWSAAERRAIEAVDDPAARVVGAGDTAGLGCAADAGRPASASHLMAETLGELLWQRTVGRSRVISVSGKVRSALLMAGPRGKAFWPHECTGRLVTSSTCYATEEDLPSWVGRFPPAPAPVSGFLETPAAMDWVLAAAESAVTGMRLGSWESPDLLWVGLSAHDAVGHHFGPASPEAREACRREDRILGEFMEFLDRRVGPEAWTLALSADHASGNIPESTAAWQGDPEMRDPLRPHQRPGDRPLFEDRARRKRFPPPGRLLADPFLHAADSVSAALGAPPGRWRWWDPYMDFVPDSAGPHAPLPEALLRELRANLTARFPMARMFVRSEMADTAVTRDTLLRAARLGYLPARAGDLCVAPDPGWILIFQRDGTRHGAPYAYDNHVPLVFYGAGVRPGRHPEPVSTADVAPTLGGLLGIGSPAQAEGHDLTP